MKGLEQIARDEAALANHKRTSLGFANEDGDAVQLEMRAAQIAADIFRDRNMSAVERYGWRGDEVIATLIVKNENWRPGEGRMVMRHNVPLNLDGFDWQAGYLAAAIANHRDEEQ